jgi:hypothetical protein
MLLLRFNMSIRRKTGGVGWECAMTEDGRGMSQCDGGLSRERKSRAAARGWKVIGCAVGGRSNASSVQRIRGMLPLWDEIILAGHRAMPLTADLTPESTLHHVGFSVTARLTAPRIYRETARGRSTSICQAIGPRRIQPQHTSTSSSRTSRHISSVAMGFITGFVGAASLLQ